MTFADLKVLASLSYLRPRQGARMLLDLHFAALARWLGAGIVAILLTLLGALGSALDPASDPLAAEGLPPITIAIVQFVLIIVPAGLLFAIGERTGSSARFIDALLVMTWVSLLLLPFQIVAILALGFSQSLSDLTILALCCTTFWLLTNFVTELHGYQSRLNVFLGMLAVSVVLGLLMLPFMDPKFH